MDFHEREQMAALSDNCKAFTHQITQLQSDLTKAREELEQAREQNLFWQNKCVFWQNQSEANLATAQESARQCRIAAGVTVKELEQKLAVSEAENAKLVLELDAAYDRLNATIDSAAQAKEGRAE